MAGTTKIVIDGREYGSLEELPPEARRIYEQTMAHLKQARPGDAPAVTEHLSPAPGVEVSRTEYGPVLSEKIIFNGREYASTEELPPEVRAQVEATKRAAAEGRLGSGESHRVTIQRLDSPTTKFMVGGREVSVVTFALVVVLAVLLVALALVVQRYL